MEPIQQIGLVTAAIPFVTLIAKKLFQTKRIPDQWRAGVHAVIPIILGVIATGLTAHANGMDWITSLAVGLGSGGAASSARDIDKDLIGITGRVLDLFKKKPAST